MVLQVRDINLTPDHPTYEGEEWHIQGQTVCRLFSIHHGFTNLHLKLILPTLRMSAFVQQRYTSTHPQTCRPT